MGILKLQKSIILAFGLCFISLPVLAYNPADVRVKEACSRISMRGFSLSANQTTNNAPVIFSTNHNKEICIGRDGTHVYHRTVVFHGGDNPQRWDGKLLNQKYCLNAYKPRNGSVVNLYRCDARDSEQTWVTSFNNPYGKAQIRKVGTDLCLNSYRTSEGSRLNLWKCDKNDQDQLFDVDYSYPLAGP